MSLSKRKLFRALLSWHTFLTILWLSLAFQSVHWLEWSSPLVLGTVALSYVVYYFVWAAVPVKVYPSHSAFLTRVVGRMPCLHGTGYFPTPYILHADLQTMYCVFGRPRPRFAYQRELASGVYADEELCVLDWSLVEDDDGTTRPLIVVFHGLTGGTDDDTVRYVTLWLNRAGYNVVVPVRRGCADAGQITRPKHYAYGNDEDTVHTVDYISAKFPKAPLYAVGISAGSNVMCNYMGSVGAEAKFRAALSVSNGYCWDKGTAALQANHPVWDVIMAGMVNYNLFWRHLSVFESHPDTPETLTPMKDKKRRKIGSLREYDDEVSRRLHGFGSLKDFYDAQSCVHRLHRICTPTLFINSIDDPLASSLCIPYKQLSENSNLVLVTTEGGGHLGWAEGWFPFCETTTYLDRLIVEYFAAVTEEEKRTGRGMRPR